MLNEQYKSMLGAKSVIRELSEYATARGKEIGYDHYEYTHIFSVIPQVRFSWVNTPIVTCYSEIGVGFSVVDFNRNTESTFVQFAGQLTFVGVQVGYKWYGSAEFGVGPMGILRLGFGYRFNGQKNN